MKTLKTILAFSILISIGASAKAQNTSDSTGLPGDNLNLYATLDLFKQSSSVEDFEKKLNDPKTKLNNLDLNNDGKTDYIRVVDYGKGDLHSIVLQDPINGTESQDVAVIEIEKKDGDVVHVQMVGDEALYGKNYIIEPQMDQQPAATNAAPAGSSSNDDVYNNGNNNNVGSNTTAVVFVNAWAWPSVQYMYGPSYSFYVSPWYWGYYPGWWAPWRPLGYYSYWHGAYGYGYPGYHYYHRGFYNRMPAVHEVYYGHRMASVTVQKNITTHVYAPRTAPGGRNINNANPGGKTSSTGGRPMGGQNGVPNQGRKTTQAPASQPKQATAPKANNNWGGMESKPNNAPKAANNGGQPRNAGGGSKINTGGGQQQPRNIGGGEQPHNNAGAGERRGGNVGGGQPHVGGGGGGNHGGGGGGGRRR